MKTEHRGHSSWWELHEDGTVTLVILRRVGSAEGTWNRLRFPAATKAAAEAAYANDGTSLARQERDARRRASWGPRELRGRATTRRR